MNLFIMILLVFSTILLAPSDARGVGGRSSSGGSWKSSGSSLGSSSAASGISRGSSSGSSGGSWSSSSGSSGSSWSSSSGSSGNSWSSSSGSSGSYPGSLSSSGSHRESSSTRRDSPFGSSQSSRRDISSPKRSDPLDSPTSSMHRSNKPGRQTNPNDDPVFGDHDGQSSTATFNRLWNRKAWIRHRSSQSGSQSNTGHEFDEPSFYTDIASETESSAPTIYDILPSCENFGEAMWIKYYGELRKKA